jgi:hypothetical protein
MRKHFLDFIRTIVVGVVAGVMFLGASCLAQPQQESSTDRDGSLKHFLQSYVGLPPDGGDDDTQYSAAFVDLRDNGAREVVVYLSGSAWCGTGGCTMLILAPEGASYKVVTKTTVTRLPIRMLATKSNGWHDISVVARINGNEPLYESVLSYNGKTYPTNPSVPPAHRLKGKVEGKTVMSEKAEDKPLYQ